MKVPVPNISVNRHKLSSFITLIDIKQIKLVLLQTDFKSQNGIEAQLELIPKLNSKDHIFFLKCSTVLIGYSDRPPSSELMSL